MLAIQTVPGLNSLAGTSLRWYNIKKARARTRSMAWDIRELLIVRRGTMMILACIALSSFLARRELGRALGAELRTERYYELCTQSRQLARDTHGDSSQI